MDVPKSIMHLVAGIVLAAVVGLAIQGWTSTSAAAQASASMNAIQDTDIAVIKVELQHLKRSDEWQSQALRTLLRDRGLPEPK